jgi:hypothetical protein
MLETDSLQSFLAYRDAPCPGCGYSLLGLTGDRCPECGQALKLGVVSAGRSRASAAKARPRSAWAGVAAHPVAIFLAAAIGMGLMQGPRAAGLVFLLWAGIFAAVWCWAGVRAYMFKPGIPPDQRQFRVAAGGLIMVLAVVAIASMLMAAVG